MGMSCRINLFAEAEGCFGFRAVVPEKGVILEDNSAKPHPPCSGSSQLGHCWHPQTTIQVDYWISVFLGCSALADSFSRFEMVVIVREVLNLVA